ncbi:MAG: hypothetical protein JNL80_05055 [Phycisphaerae bacterium]|nr:hypothetical protein [Phycisphaerae bacterium]
MLSFTSSLGSADAASRRRSGLLPVARVLSLALIGGSLAAAVLSTSGRVDGCGGVPAPQVCGKSTSLTKATPPVFPLAFVGGFAMFPVTVNVAAWGNACPAPMSTTISLTVACAPPPGAAGSITIPTPTPGVYTALVPVFLPPGPPRLCTVIGNATTSWSDGSTTSGPGDTTFCVVEPSPIDPSIPRLGMERITEGVQRAHPGDQRVHLFRFTNNDPTETVTITLNVDSEQTARLGTGTGFLPGSGDGVFSISDPADGDNFPIAFLEDTGPDGCIDLPIDPMGFGVPHIAKTVTLVAGESRVVAIAQRSWPMCGCGSSCESRVDVSGVWSDGTPALACAGAGLLVDCSVPPDFSCPDGGAAWNLFNAVPGQLQGQVFNPAIAPGLGTVRVLESQVIANGMFGGLPTESTNWDQVRGRMELSHVSADGPIAFAGQFINVNAILDASAIGPGYQSLLYQMTIMEPPADLEPEWVWLDARHALTGPGIPPTLDSFFDVFYSVELDGLSNGLHRRAHILPNSFSITPMSPSTYGITFTARFPFEPGFPNVIERIDLHVDASGTLIGSLPEVNPCMASTHDCSAVGGPGCSDFACCMVVCAADPACCDVTWDRSCVEFASTLCGGDPPLVNDECQGAVELDEGAEEFSTIGATTSDIPLEPQCDEGFGLNLVNDVWYYYQSGGNGVATVTTCGEATFDTRIAVYSGCPSDGGVLLGCNDDSPDCPNFTSSVSFPAFCGGVYYIRLGGYNGSGSGVVTISNDGECDEACPADLNDDGTVNGADLAILLGAWATTGPGDLTGNGVVDAADLAVLLGAFGPCAPAVTADYDYWYDPDSESIKYAVEGANGDRDLKVTAEKLGAVGLKDGTPDLHTGPTGKDDESSGVKCRKAGQGSIRIKILKNNQELFNQVICFECAAEGAAPVEKPCP